MPKKVSDPRKKRKMLFFLLGGIVFLMIVATVFYRLKGDSAQKELSSLSQEISVIQKQIDALEDESGYNKLELVKRLLSEVKHMPWSKYIPLLINMLLELQELDGNKKDKIELSDFRVSLESINLEGTVSRLLLLYYNNPKQGYISLIDKFRSLDFLEEIKIMSYKKNKKSNEFGFALHANVIIDDGSK